MSHTSRISPDTNTSDHKTDLNTHTNLGPEMDANDIVFALMYPSSGHYV